MNILEALVQLRDDLKIWVTNNLNALNKKIDEKTIPIDSKLSATSTNPVQNKVINAKISSLSNLVGDTSVASQISQAIASQDLFSGDYNDLINAPSISEDNLDNVIIADNDGNIIFKVDADGAHTTDIEIDGKSLRGKIPMWDAKSDFSGDYNDLKNAPAIVENETGNLTVADEDGNIIFKVDAEGTHTTTLDAKNVTIENENITDIIDDKIADAVEGFESFSGDYNDLENAPNISDDGSSDLKVSDKDGNIIAQIDADGLKTTKVIVNSVNINGTNISEDTSGKVELADENGNVIARVDNDGIHTTEIEADGIKIKETLSNHIDNNNVHVTVEEKTLWNNKAGFSGDYNDLINAPNISQDEENKEVVITDEDGNIIFKVDENGAHTTNVTASEVIINGKKVNESIGSVQSSVNNLNRLVGTKSVADQISEAVDGFESFSGDYNDLHNQPNILENKSNEFTIVDTKDYIIAKFNQDGLVTTQINSNKIILNNEDLEEKIANIMDNEELQNQLNTLHNEIHSIDYNSLKNTPPITSVQEQKLRVVDEKGNIVCLIDADGVTTTKINTDELILSNTSMDAEFADFNQRLENFDERINNFTDSVSTTIGEKFTEFNEEIKSHKSTVNTKINNFQTKITNFENSITLTKVTYSTTDLVPGTSALKTGELYIVYE